MAKALDETLGAQTTIEATPAAKGAISKKRRTESHKNFATEAKVRRLAKDQTMSLKAESLDALAKVMDLDANRFLDCCIQAGSIDKCATLSPKHVIMACYLMHWDKKTCATAVKQINAKCTAASKKAPTPAPAPAPAPATVAAA